MNTWTYRVKTACGHTIVTNQVSRRPEPRVGVWCKCIVCGKDSTIAIVTLVSEGKPDKRRKRS